MQRLVNRTAEYYWQEIEFQSMVYDRTTFILANTFADGPFPSGITFKGDFSIVNDSFNHLNMTLNKVELNFETFSGRKPKFSKQYWRYIFDHGEGTLRTLRIIKYQIEDFIIPNYLGAALTQETRPLTEFKVVGCEVKEVKERAFKNFTALEVLDLSDNHLTTLPENVFSRNINLQKILLANNQISFLTKTIFDGLPNLLLINLRKNKLTAVPAIPRHTNRRFQPMVYLMADNSIHCRCSLIWVLHELTFHHNLEIEATCSDPTMVRGMPIIEGFTRMDKEACYRVLRKDDDEQPVPEAIAGGAARASIAAPEGQAPVISTQAKLPAQEISSVAAAAPPSVAELSPKSSASEQKVDQSAKEVHSPLASLIVPPPSVALTPDHASAPQAPVSSLPDAPLQAKQAGEQPTVVNVAPQTVLNPSQSPVVGPVAAVAPLPRVANSASQVAPAQDSPANLAQSASLIAGSGTTNQKPQQQ